MKRILTFFLLLIISFNIISAVEINMNSEIPKGETIIASVSGDFLEPIERENILFYRGHVVTSFDYDIAKIDNIYYIYIKTLGKAENNYSINISGVRYMEDFKLSDKQISKSFKITNKSADFSISPGFFITHEDFLIKLQNIKYASLTINLKTEVNLGDSEEKLKFIFNGKEVQDKIILSSAQTNNLYVKVDNISKTTIRTITLSTDNTEYNIPCYIISKNPPVDLNEEENISVEEENITDKNCTFFGTLFGTCDENKTKEETNYNESKDLEEEEEENIEENITKKNNSKVDYEVVKKGNKTVVIKNGEVLNETATFKTCAQIKGDICSSDEICRNETVYAKDAQCCISQCVKKEENNNKKITGWVIIGLVLFLVLWFFVKKFRGTKIKKDTLLGSKK